MSEIGWMCVTIMVCTLFICLLIGSWAPCCNCKPDEDEDDTEE